MMYYSDDSLVYLDGEWLLAKEANTTIYGQSLHYGSAVFEGIRSYETEGGFSVFKAKEHYDRLIYSAEKMHIPFDYSAEVLEKLTYQLLEKNNLKDAYIRPLVFLEPNMSLQPVSKSHLFLAAWEWGRYLGTQQLNIMTSSYERPNPKSCHVEAKVSGHYTNSILATTEAKQKGFDEALLLDMHGYVAEGSGANFFFEKDDVLYTPALGNILPGITRATILQLAATFEYEVVEGQFTLDQVLEADAAFFTGTAAEVIGIASLDGHQFPLEWEDTMGNQLAQAYRNLVRENFATAY